jgi:hypothetical protein
MTLLSVVVCQVNPTSIAFAFPPFPRGPEISIPIYHRSESSRMAENSRQAQMKEPNQSLRMSFVARHLTMTNRRDVM